MTATSSPGSAWAAWNLPFDSGAYRTTARIRSGDVRVVCGHCDPEMSGGDHRRDSSGDLPTDCQPVSKCCFLRLPTGRITFLTACFPCVNLDTELARRVEGIVPTATMEGLRTA